MKMSQTEVTVFEDLIANSYHGPVDKDLAGVVFGSGRVGMGPVSSKWFTRYAVNKPVRKTNQRALKK